MQNKNEFILVRQSDMHDVNEKISKIIRLLNGEESSEKIKSKYVSEEEARKLFKRSATWFWQKRKAGEIDFHKVGKSTYYSIDDLKTFFKKGR